MQLGVPSPLIGAVPVAQTSRNGATSDAQSAAGPDLATLEALQILDLSYNALSGALPARWDTPKLVELDLQGNALTGPLPAGLARLPRLAYLQLQVHDAFRQQ